MSCGGICLFGLVLFAQAQNSTLSHLLSPCSLKLSALRLCSPLSFAVEWMFSLACINSTVFIVCDSSSESVLILLCYFKVQVNQRVSVQGM